MPNRIIRDGICTSETINGLTPDQEVMFYRLLVTCDDFGRYDGRAAIIKSQCFPLRDVSASMVELLLSALEKAALVTRYAVAGKPYLAVAKWDQHQRMRNARSKYPPPADGDPPPIDSKSTTVAPHAGAEVESESESESESERKGKESTPLAAGEDRRPPAARISPTKTGWQGVDDERIAMWEAAYPAVAIRTEMAGARAWVDANPSNAKSNWHRFLTSWFARAQDKAPARGRPGSRFSPAGEQTAEAGKRWIASEEAKDAERGA